MKEADSLSSDCEKSLRIYDIVGGGMAINNNNVKVIDAKIKEIDQTTQKVNATTGPGIVSKPKKKKVVILFKIYPKQNIPAPVSQSANLSIIIITLMMITYLIRNSLQV